MRISDWSSDVCSSNLDSISNYRVNSDLGVYGRGRHWDARLMADYHQLADYTLSELRLPYYRLPRAYFNWEQSFGRWFTSGVNTEAARFQHIDGQRTEEQTFELKSILRYSYAG